MVKRQGWIKIDQNEQGMKLIINNQTNKKPLVKWKE